MSDISIPGVTASKYKTDELIEGLMKVERIPKDRAEKELEAFKKQQDMWREVNQHSTTLRDTAKSLYSYNNPFGEKISTSTNERAIQATPTKDAKDQNYRVSISQVAAADSFLSSEIPKNGSVPKGIYEFTVGEKSVSFSWKGGSYKDFADAVNRRSSGLLQASIIKVSDKTEALCIESLKSGSKERLGFAQDALQFALNSGFIKKNDTGAITTSATSATVTPSTNKIIDFSVAARAKDGLVLEYTISSSAAKPEESATSTSAPDFGTPGGINYQGIQIVNATPETALTLDQTPNEKKEPIHDPEVVALRSTKNIAIPLPQLPESGEKTTVSVPLSEYGDVNAILVHNKNTDKTVSIEDICIYDPKQAGDYVPVNPISVAQDAILKFEGITITRSKNDIDDLIPGVTINVHEQTDKTETLGIKPDTKLAKDSIIELVAKYNRLLADVNILTQDKPEIISELEYFTEDEKKTAKDRLGMLIGDSTLNAFKASLQRIVTGGYPSEGSSLKMLSQLGISSKSAAGAGIDSSRLRGYLEIDEKKLDDALTNHLGEVKALFGLDTNSDLIVDSGVGFSLDSTLTPYVQTGGIFATKNNGLATRITSTQKKIDTLTAQLKTKESELKTKYGQMEGTLNSLQSQSTAISNFSNQNKNQ
jgi:flagellar hook-associated protein 2